MEVNGKIEPSRKLCDELKEWLYDLMETQEFCSFMEERAYAMQERSEIDDLSAYAYYFKNHALSADEYSQLAEVIVHSFCGAMSPRAARMYMADSPEVLIDDNKAKLWLMPLVKANRTSLSFERGTRLAKSGKSFYGLAGLIMQKAADEGDEHCAMFLIKNAIFSGKAKNSIKNDEKATQKSLAYEKASALIALRKYRMSETLLRAAADNGDVDCAMLLIQQTLISAAHQLTSEKNAMD